MSQKISVVIPAYCAEHSIKKVVLHIPDWVAIIIIVDDCSIDKTVETVYPIVDNTRIHLIQHNINQGVGGAMISGYKKALELGADIIVKMDSDGQMDPSYLPALISPILKSKADFTKGNRFIHRVGLRDMPKVRAFGNTFLSFFTKVSSGYWDIFDPTNGYTAINAKVIRELDFKDISKGYFFETSMLIELGLLKAVVKDVFVPGIYKDEKSHLSELKTLFEFPPKLIRGMIKRITYLYFIRDFTAVSILLLVGLFAIGFGFFWGIFYWFTSASEGVVTPTGTIMISVLPIILGVQFVLQALVLDIQNIPKEIISED